MSMPVYDRYWWLRIAAPVCAAGVLVKTWSDLIQAWRHGAQLGAVVREPAPIAFWALIVFGASLACARGVPQAREREARRRAALHGEPDAIPLAEPAPDPAQAPAALAEPLALLWTTTRSVRFILGPLLLIILSTLLALAGVCLVAAFAIASNQVGGPPTTTIGRLCLALGCMVAGSATLILIAFLIRGVPIAFGRPLGLVATTEGITVFSSFGQKTMRWEEMRLLEAWYEPGQISPSYVLYSARESLGWRRRYDATHKPVGLTMDEMEWRCDTLLALIGARAGLAPRAFSGRAM